MPEFIWNLLRGLTDTHNKRENLHIDLAEEIHKLKLKIHEKDTLISKLTEDLSIKDKEILRIDSKVKVNWDRYSKLVNKLSPHFTEIINNSSALLAELGSIESSTDLSIYKLGNSYKLGCIQKAVTELRRLDAEEFNQYTEK